MAEAESMAERFKRLREEKEFTQARLAEAAGVPLGTLRNWEQGRRVPQLDAAYRVAKALGITLDELAGKAFETKPEGKPAKRKSGK
jgi:transcriptional regulator with XRE-family HTH domain